MPVETRRSQLVAVLSDLFIISSRAFSLSCTDQIVAMGHTAAAKVCTSKGLYQQRFVPLANRCTK
eukprot:IDg19675t1